jgi:hypothetical protein
MNLGQSSQRRHRHRIEDSIGSPTDLFLPRNAWPRQQIARFCLVQDHTCGFTHGAENSRDKHSCDAEVYHLRYELLQG